jgi:hypothetical protein
LRPDPEIPSPNPAPSCPDLAGKIAGIFPIDAAADSAGIKFGKSGNPDLAWIGEKRCWLT